MRRSLGAVLSSTMFAVVASAQQAVPAAFDARSLPAPTGRFAVGVHRFEWVDTAREELGTPDRGDRRTLVVRIWAPTSARGGAEAPYLPELAAYRTAGSIEPRSAAMLAGVEHHSLADAPLPAGGERYPVIVFSPGNGEMEHVYTTLAEELASHGYLFALVVHPGVSDVAYAGGRVLRRYRRLYDPKPDGWEASIPAALSVNLKRALYDTMYVEAARELLADVSHAIDRLAAIDRTPGGPFSGRIDMRRIATFGHSYGGNVAIEACARDTRVRACVQMDGAAFGPVREEGLAKPYLLFRPSSVNAGTPRGVAQDQLFGALRADGYEVNVTGATHRSFMDAHFLDPSSRGEAIAPERVLRIVSAYTLAFLARYLDGTATPLPTLRQREFPEVRLRVLRSDP